MKTEVKRFRNKKVLTAACIFSAVAGFLLRGLFVDKNIPVSAGAYWEYVAGVLLAATALPAIVYICRTIRNPAKQMESELELHSIQEELEKEIVQHRQTEDELMRASAIANDIATRAELANIFKSQFLADMSHEIRTPMNSIIGFCELLLDEGLTSEQRDYAETIHNNSKHLLNLINDILDFSKIEAGKYKIEIIDWPLDKILNNVMSLSSFKAAEKNIEFKISTSRDLPENIQTDPTRLTQCLVNLINNAIKFTEQGYVHVNISLQEDTARPFIRFDIEDTGIGIPENRREAVFDAFVQAEGSTPRKYGGTGLGLTITKRLAELMGGSLTLTSEEGKGSVFSLILPACLTSAEINPANAPQQQLVSL